MSLISLEFFIFFFIVCIVYFLVPSRFQWIWLLISSLVFYFRLSSGSLSGFLFFILIVLINWASSRYIEISANKKPVYKCALIFDIIIFIFFKYSDFIYSTTVRIFERIGIDVNNEISAGIVRYSQENCPPKISYFILILIAYITDVYWGKKKAITNPGKAMLFASYFPIMTSGPIVRFGQMEDQLWGEKHIFSYDRCTRGMERVIWGLFKKMVLSERLAVVVSTIYEYYQVYNGLYIIVAVMMFAMQIYCDFSGLMDIVIGCSEVLGITLPENFRQFQMYR